MKNFLQLGKRFLLFAVVNILVVITLSIVVGLILHFFPQLGGRRGGGNWLILMAVLALVIGMGGAFITLAISRWMAKAFMGVQVIDPDTANPELRTLVQMVHGFAQRAGLPAMPEVGIYDSPEVNAFATGPSKSRSLVAVSTGLLQQMNRAEAEGVIAHEVAHIANGDMVTMTLVQGVINAFVFFLSHVLGFIVAQALGGRKDDDDRGPSFMDYIIQNIFIYLFEFVFGLLGHIVVCWFSRRREFHADAGGMLLAGKDRMIGMLRGLQRLHEQPLNLEAAGTNSMGFEALKISGKSGGLMAIFSTHPPLEERIAHLESLGR